MAALTGHTIVNLTNRGNFSPEEYLRRATCHLKAGRVVIVQVGNEAPIPFEEPFLDIYPYGWFRPELEYHWWSDRAESWSPWERTTTALREVTK